MARMVAIYARVSTEHEAQLSALENQVQYYDNILEAHPDWTLYKRYIDEGITGTSIKKRKNFLQMIEDAKDGCFDLIITREVSRFARNTVDTLQETRNLKRMGVEVYFTEDNIWTFNDEDGELKLTIMATLAQNESKKTSQRVKAGQQISFENGVIYGTGNILGYDRVGDKMVVNEEQAETVKLIFSLFLKGMGTTDIKYELEKQGRLTAMGKKKWSASTITRVLQNPFYCGTIVYRKSYIPDFLEQKPKKNNGEVPQTIKEGTHQILVSKEDFIKVQDKIRTHSSHLPKKKNTGHGIPQSIWSKKLKCNCDSSFNKAVYHKDKNGENKTYCYQCYNQKNNGSVNSRLKRGLDTEGACGVPLVQEWKLYAMANVIFDNIWTDKERIVEIANNLIDETIKEESCCNEFDAQIETNSKKIETYKRKLEKLLDAYLSDLMEKEEYARRKQELDYSINELNSKNQKLELEKGTPKDIVKSKIKNLKQTIMKHLYDENNRVSDNVIDSFVSKIKVKENSFEWKLNCLCDIIDADVVGKCNSAQVNLYIGGELPPKQSSGTSCNC